MRKTSYWAVTVLSACALGLPRAEPDSEIDMKRVSIVGQFDNGQIISGQMNQYDNAQLKNYEFDGDFFQRTGVWITQEAVVANRLRLVMGVGGLFWYALPMSQNINTRITQFGPGISQAQGTYAFGGFDDPVASLQMGYFPYKYNPDAKNLGEYLLRSGTYPGYLTTGGWNMIGSAAHMVQGLRLNFSLWNGIFESDVLIAMENAMPPMFSMTPAYVATLKPVEGIQASFGVACNHCLPIKPSRESPKVRENSVIRSAVYDSTAGGFIYDRDTTAFYTFQGLKVSANASFDPKAFIPMDFLGPQDLKLYGEVAVLGWKNYSYLYDKRSERMPMMVGFNLPTFKLLDLLAFEIEHYNSRFINSFYSQYRGAGLPIPMFPGADADGAITPAELQQYEKDASEDNWKWSIFAKKQIVKGVEIYAQAASDHIRTINAEAGPMPAMTPITNRNGKEWYYILRLQFGI